MNPKNQEPISNEFQNPISKPQNDILKLNNLIKELQSENLKLQKKIARKDAQNISLKNENRSMKKLIVAAQTATRDNNLASLTDEELQTELDLLERKRHKTS